MWITVLPETHSSSKVKQGWKEDFQDEVFFFSQKIKFLGCSNSLLAVSHPEEIWGQYFQPRVWSTFLNNSKILLIYIILHTFSHF